DGTPAALRHIQPGRWMAIPGGFAACTAGDPDGTRTDGPQAADPDWAAHSTSPIASLRSSAVRRCDNYHGIVDWIGPGIRVPFERFRLSSPPSAAARDCLE